MSAIDCLSTGPDGARCQKIRNHIGRHGGIDRRGAWVHW